MISFDELVEQYSKDIERESDVDLGLGLEMGRNIVRYERPSVEALERNRHNLEANQLSWHDTDKRELGDILEKACARASRYSFSFRQGVQKGMLREWMLMRSRVLCGES